MIISFGDKATSNLFNGVSSRHVRKLPNQIHEIALYKLDILNAAQKLDDLRSPPRNRLEPLELTQKTLATHVGVPVQRINEIVRGKRGVTPDTAWLLSEALCTTPEFWLNLQSIHDLSANRPDHHIQPLIAVRT